MESDLQAVKKTLKKWESCFSFAHQRKPNREDIEGAPDNIKEAYKKYAQLKKQAPESAKVEVWGRELNKSAQESSEDAKEESKKSYLSSVKEKLYARAFTQGGGSVFKKKSSQNRNDVFRPDRSTSEQQEADNENFKPFSDSQGMSSNENNDRNADGGHDIVKRGGMFEKALHLTKRTPVAKSPSLDVRSPFNYHQANAKKVAMKAKFLQTFSSNSGNRDDGDFAPSEFADGEKKKSDFTKDKEKESLESLPAFKGETNAMDSCKETKDTKSRTKSTPLVNSNEPDRTDCEKEIPSNSRRKTSVESKDKERGKGTESSSISDTTPNSTSPKTVNNSQKTSSKNSDIEANSNTQISKEDIKSSESMCQSPKIQSPAVKKSFGLQMRDGRTLNLSKTTFENFPLESSAKRKRRISGESTSLGDSSFHEERDGDVIWQSDSLGQFPDDINQPSESDESPEKPDGEPPKKKPKTFARNMSTGGGSQSQGNFIRLNMKMKRYSRGRGGYRGGRIKRMQWKEKMKARSESFGSDKCFKCGGTGHWANKCRGKAQGEKKWTEKANDEDFPTLQEAMSIARGEKPVLKKRKKEANETKTDDQEVTENGEEVKDAEVDDLDEIEVVRSAYVPPPVPPATEPLYELQPDGSLPETPQEVFDYLKELGYSGFRPGQEKAVMRILCGESTLVVLATGSGKSLCYQLPAYIYGQKSRGITLCISPLVSLMEDQVTGLPPGMRGVCLHTNMTQSQKDKVTAAVAEGKVHFLLVSPEALVGGMGSGMLAGITLPQIAFACIDEAHCLSEWSHHFRPSYLRVCKVLREQMGVKCLLGLTATATLTTAASVCQHLGIKKFEQATIRSAPVPRNLMMTASRDENKDEAIIHLLQGERFSSCCSIIVYCTRRQETERLATLIRTCLKDATMAINPDDLEPTNAKGKKGKAKKPKAKKFNYWDAEAYHTGLTAAKRKRVQNCFMDGSLRVVVATVAFGMGLDKSNVRGIIHYNLPRSFESYVQEIGRAGRDGKTSHCHVFLDEEGGDMQELKRHIYGNTIDRYIIKKLVQKAFRPCRCKDLHNKHAEAVKECFEDDGINYDDIDLDELMSQQENQENNTDQKEANCDNEEGKETDSSQHTAKENDVDNGVTQKQTSKDPKRNSIGAIRPNRICTYHERAIPIEETVQSLDIKEDSISTLLCYLELHPSRWVENMNPVYSMCTLNCYGGPLQLMHIAKKCPPVAVAIAFEKRKGVSHAQQSRLEFDVVRVSDRMGWESGPVKRQLKLLKWNIASVEAGAHPSKTGVMVEFSNLSFHFRSPGDLSDEELDEVVDFLSDRIQAQERTDLANLHLFNKTLYKVSFKNWFLCADDVNEERCESLRKSILAYFDHQPKLEEGQVTPLTFAQEGGSSQEEPVVARCPFEGQLRTDIRQFINLYGTDHQLSGRAIARIFHGIASPCFPSEIWGRVRRFWRCHLETDFNIIRKIATEMLIGSR